MKKGYLLGIIWIIIAAGLSAFLLIALIRNGGSGYLKLMGKDDAVMKEEKFVRGKISHEEVFTGQLDELDVEVGSLAVRIEEGNASDVKVSYYAGAELYTETNMSGGKLSIKQNRSVPFFSVLKNPTIVVSVPKKEYKLISATASSGAITVDGLECKELFVKASSGALNIDDVNAEDLKANTSSGRIKLYDTHGKSAEMKATSGAISAHDLVFDEVKAGASSGAVSVSGKILQADLSATSGAISFEDDVALTKDSSFKASSGAVRIKLTPSSEYCFETSITSGMMKNAFKSNSNGSVLIKASATSGAVKITKK